MKKNIFLLLFLFLALLIKADPKDPDEPKIKDNKNSKDKFNIEYRKQNGFYTKGYIEGMSGFYLNDLMWQGNENKEQHIYIDFVKSIEVKGYTIKKIQKDNLSLVFYIPYVFDIELKNGTSIKGAKGRIKELERFTVYTEIGKEKCYTYFVRYWLEDKQMFLHNNSKDFNEKPTVPESTVVYIEFVD
ncbi:MAG TPA: hypothetical protein PLE45_01925 [Spirochaetota bacterium]|nr:hypothetical protein [Spirochaetota bacterium]HOL57139.1 hypothetical protein [Spirochaetota bacterium]HPP05083.1 hypothetical protein [Spirochaetota bacterium]